MQSKSLLPPKNSNGSATSMSLLVIGYILIIGGIVAPIAIINSSPSDFKHVSFLSPQFLFVVGPAITTIVIGLIFSGLGELINNSESIRNILMQYVKQQNKT